MFKVSETQNRICMGLAIAALVAIFFYQVVYATNESSYQFGFKYSTDNFQCSVIGNCKAPSDSDVYPLCDDSTRGITNSTACVDGFVNGWIKWCKSDTVDCVQDIIHDNFPGYLYAPAINLASHDEVDAEDATQR